MSPIPTYPRFSVHNNWTFPVLFIPEAGGVQVGPGRVEPGATAGPYHEEDIASTDGTTASHKFAFTIAVPFFGGMEALSVTVRQQGEGEVVAEAHFDVLRTWVYKDDDDQWIVVIASRGPPSNVGSGVEFEFNALDVTTREGNAGVANT